MPNTNSPENWGFKSENIMMLIDETRDVRQHPTRANMLHAMKWLVQDPHPHDSLFFHCMYQIKPAHNINIDQMQILDTGVKFLTKMETKLTGLTKV